jgi:Fe-S cluster biogenesis protein NfuA
MDTTLESRSSTVLRILSEVRPAIQADGGDIELVAIEGMRVKVRLSGKCRSCALAMQTLGGIRRKLMHALNEPVLVVPAADEG